MFINTVLQTSPSLLLYYEAISVKSCSMQPLPHRNLLRSGTPSARHLHANTTESTVARAALSVTEDPVQ
jgi:hypothetical protein